MSDDNLDAGLERGSRPAYDEEVTVYARSIAISLKRIADALNEPNEYGEVGGAAIRRLDWLGLRENG